MPVQSIRERCIKLLRIIENPPQERPKRSGSRERDAWLALGRTLLEMEAHCYFTDEDSFGRVKALGIPAELVRLGETHQRIKGLLFLLTQSGAGPGRISLAPSRLTDEEARCIPPGWSTRDAKKALNAMREFSRYISYFARWCGVASLPRPQSGDAKADEVMRGLGFRIFQEGARDGLEKVAKQMLDACEIAKNDIQLTGRALLKLARERGRPREDVELVAFYLWACLIREGTTAERATEIIYEFFRHRRFAVLNPQGGGTIIINQGQFLPRGRTRIWPGTLQGRGPRTGRREDREIGARMRAVAKRLAKIRFPKVIRLEEADEEADSIAAEQCGGNSISRAN